MSQSLLFCSIVQAEYDALINTLETLQTVPLLGLRALKGYIKKFEYVIMAFIDGRLDIIEILLNQMWELTMNSEPFDRLDIKNVCRLAYTCNALRKHLFPTDSSDDPSYVLWIDSSIRDSLRDFDDNTTYENFDKYVCRLGFQRTLRGFQNKILAEIEDELDNLIIKLGINRIDEWMNNYKISSLSFLRALQDLDKFAQCAFSTCNFAQTAINKRENISERMLYERQGTGWSVKIDASIEKAIIHENNIRSRVDALRTRLANPKFDSQGAKISDIMKF